MYRVGLACDNIFIDASFVDIYIPTISSSTLRDTHSVRWNERWWNRGRSNGDENINGDQKPTHKGNSDPNLDLVTEPYYNSVLIVDRKTALFALYCTVYYHIVRFFTKMHRHSSKCTFFKKWNLTILFALTDSLWYFKQKGTSSLILIILKYVIDINILNYYFLYT